MAAKPSDEQENDMSGKLNVLVTGATGKQGGHLVGEFYHRTTTENDNGNVTQSSR